MKYFLKEIILKTFKVIIPKYKFLQICTTVIFLLVSCQRVSSQSQNILSGNTVFFLLLSNLFQTTEPDSSASSASPILVSGILYDSTGNPLSLARMGITNVSKSLSRTITLAHTDTEGMYEIITFDGSLLIAVTRSDNTNLGNFSMKVEGEKTPIVINNNTSFQSTTPVAMKRFSTNSNSTTLPSIYFLENSYSLQTGQFINPIIPRNTGGNISSCTVSPQLPTGLKLRKFSCAIVGTPSGDFPATQFQIVAINSFGQNMSSIALSSSSPPTPISLNYSGTPFTFSIGQAVSIIPSYSGGKIKTCTSDLSLSSIGLFLDPLSCNISGNLSASQIPITYSITASNISGSTTGYITIEVTGSSGNSVVASNIVSMPYGILKTGQTTSYLDGDDGWYQKGVDRNFTVGGTSGLIWQRCSGGQNNDSTCSGNAQTYTWDEANTYCNSLSIGGRIWRLPTVRELYSLIEFNKITMPNLSLILFPNTMLHYWSLNKGNSDKNNYWFVSYSGFGYVNPMPSTIAIYARCISGEVESKFIFIDNNNGTITDNSTGLLWQKCNIGQVYDSGCSGSSTSTNWNDAIRFCNNLNLLGRAWRLPNINELITLYNHDVYPSISDTLLYFGGDFSDSFWTSTNLFNIKWYAHHNILGIVDESYNSGKIKCVSGP